MNPSIAEVFRVLFCCTGNICRSPSAEAIFRHMVAAAGLSSAIRTDSAGTHDYHAGDPPDQRSCAAALRRGYDLSALRARRMEPSDFHRFDLILAMDAANRSHLSGMAPRSEAHKLRMMMEFSLRFQETEVPDPYYGAANGFELVLDMLEDAAQGLLATIIGRDGGLPQGRRRPK